MHSTNRAILEYNLTGFSVYLALRVLSLSDSTQQEKAEFVSKHFTSIAHDIKDFNLSLPLLSHLCFYAQKRHELFLYLSLAYKSKKRIYITDCGDSCDFDKLNSFISGKFDSGAGVFLLDQKRIKQMMLHDLLHFVRGCVEHNFLPDCFMIDEFKISSGVYIDLLDVTENLPQLLNIALNAKKPIIKKVLLPEDMDLIDANGQKSDLSKFKKAIDSYNANI